ncbi:sulfur carrier protein ThiS [Pseudovibrio sp. Tun.PSC04-5.I4]|uniref:sulfur carrier protein ThiS n=1 Tax=Pseudovibrio sp. Tun.PSC04-5.I4 TaxID=1798213 RepID=UPI00088CFFE3|nr:sulfur carrier protein ThiS [Pseudovibrio sp. Tun.PSC04-5.I4]SDQ31632.1 sulfur carrier protein [Pseudovibrio sp. Tun.PSC04-5.I4]
MKIIVNAEQRDVSGCTLAKALEELDFISTAIATALNGCFVPREQHAETTLSEGDRLEVLAPMQGG